MAKRSPTVRLLPSLHYCCWQGDIRALESEAQLILNFLGDAIHTKDAIWSGRVGEAFATSATGHRIPVVNGHLGNPGLHRMAGHGTREPPTEGYCDHYLFVTYLQKKMDCVPHPLNPYKMVMIPSAEGSGPAAGAQVRVRLF